MARDCTNFRCRQLRRAMGKAVRNWRSDIQRRLLAHYNDEPAWGKEGSLGAAAQGELNTAILSFILRILPKPDLKALHVEDCDLEREAPA